MEPFTRPHQRRRRTRSKVVVIVAGRWEITFLIPPNDVTIRTKMKRTQNDREEIIVLCLHRHLKIRYRCHGLVTREGNGYDEHVNKQEEVERPQVP